MSALNAQTIGAGPAVQAGLAPAVRLGSMIWIPGGDFIMGSNKFYREERPARRETVGGFWIDPKPVTNAEFGAFVQATGYRTTSERAPDPAVYPDADPLLLVPGSAVFTKPRGPVGLRDHQAWWAYVPGANWQHPEGPGSSVDDRPDHPVVHVSFEDVSAYAALGGQGASDRSRMGIRRARRIGRRDLRMGRGFRARRASDGEHLARAVSFRESRRGWIRRHFAGRSIPGQSIRPLRHDRQCLGVDGVCLQPGARRHLETFLLPVRHGRRSRGSQGCQRRLASLCAELLPALPAGGASKPVVRIPSTTHIGFRCVLRAPAPAH